MFIWICERLVLKKQVQLSYLFSSPDCKAYTYKYTSLTELMGTDYLILSYYIFLALIVKPTPTSMPA